MEARQPATSDDVRRWYEVYGEAVHRRCQRILRNDAFALDATQDVFLTAHRARGQLDKQASALSWLLTIADRTCLDALRRQRRRPVIEPWHEALDPDTEHLERHLINQDLVNRVLVHCSPGVQAIVLLRFYDELEPETIATELGLSRRTVYRRLDKFYSRARQLLGTKPPRARRWAG